jgi:hypothetical protein
MTFAFLPPMKKTKSSTSGRKANEKRPRKFRQAEPISAAAVEVPREDEPAFIPDPEKTHQRVRDDLAEYLGENFVASVTTGSDVQADAQDEVLPAEIGGPFVETDGQTEFGRTAAPEDFEDEPTLPEPFPTAVRSGVEPSRRPETSLSAARSRR